MDCPACHTPNIDGARFCAKCGALLPMQSSAGDDPLIGQIVGGRYRITHLLGEGGMGRVYVAEQQMGTNVRKVAVKTLQTQYAKDPQILARFHRECGTVSELEHPNTIQFFDFGQTPNGELYIAMEFVQGESLADALKPGPMTPARVIRILSQICGSLEEAHARGIVHRDLKPDNVILTTRAGQSDFVKVLDFGIAKRSEAKDQAQEQKLTQQGMVLGTPPYMSPEQFTGKELDARSDIYSLGVIAYELLTGRLPFDADTPWQWATQHMTAQPFPFETITSAAGVPRAMKAAILRALSKSPADRQRNARVFLDELTADSLGAGSSLPAPAAHGAAAGTAAMTPLPFGNEIDAKGKTQMGGEPLPFAHGAPVLSPPSPGRPPTLSGGQTFPTAANPVAHGPPARPSSSGKGLIIGLASAAGVLGILGVVLAARGMKPKDEVQLTSPFATSGAATSEAFAVPAPAAPATDEKPPGSATVTSTVSKANPTAPPRPAAPATPPAPALKGEAACAEARRLADVEDITGAARAFAGCDGASAAAAKASIARNAPKAAQRKIFNGDCAGAKAVVAAATGVGAGAGAAPLLDKCKK